MNYLAHAFLASFDDELMVGGLLADFVTGLQARSLKPNVQLGVKLHHHLDRFTDCHSVTKIVTSWFRPQFARYAVVLSDVAYDYALANQFSAWTSTPLSDFARQVYASLEASQPLPERMARVFPYMKNQDWLSSYADIRGIESALNRMQRRVSKPVRLVNAAPIMLQRSAELTDLFETFFTDVQAETRRFLQID